MKLFNLKSKATWLAAWASVTTMVLSPVALGQQAERFSAEQVQSALKEMGLNKKITVGEFYQNTKHLYPERIRSQIEPVLMNFKNTMMPEFTVTKVKGSDGREIANIRMTSNGQLLNFQWFGEKEKFLKFQNTNITEIDLINFSDMFAKVLAGDESLRKQVTANIPKKNVTVKASKFEYPSVTKEIWQSMTPQDRANYMINLRLLWHDARKVISEMNERKAEKKQKTSAVDKMDLLWQSLFIKDAEAASKVRARNDKVVKPTETVGDATACLVAGYITTYGASVCEYKKVKPNYLDIPIVQKAINDCKTSEIACNPIVFGTPNGKAICLDPTVKSFQIATHYNGPCETLIGTNHGGGGNHLGEEIKFLNNEDIHEGRYADGNIKINDIRNEVKKNLKGDFKATEDFLNGLLKSKGAKADLFTSNAPIDESTLKMIREIKNQFEDDIGDAVSSCKASSNAETHKDKNFWEACDQLQRRFIFVKEYLATKCPDSSSIQEETFKCACGSGPAAIMVNPGEKKCPIAQPVVATPPPVSVVPPGNPPVKPPVRVECGPGETRKVTTGNTGSASEGVEAITCVPIQPGARENTAGSGVWDFMKKLLPFAIGGVALFAMYKLFSPKKPTLNSAGDLCPNGFKPPCGQTCPLPQAMQSSGICGCAACPPGQAIVDSATSTSCMCASTAPVNAIVTCPDGVTKVSSLANCPSPTYTCWNGTTVKNPLNCPEKPTIPQPGSTTK